MTPSDHPAILACPLCHATPLVIEDGARCPECDERFPEKNGRPDFRYIPEEFRTQEDVRVDIDYEPADPSFRNRIYGGARLACKELLGTLATLHEELGALHVLDIGIHLFGAGGFKPYTAEADALIGHYVAIDPSTWYLPPVDEHYEGRDFFLAFGEHMPVRGDHFDAVVSTATFDHLFDPDRCLDEILRVLRPGGRFIVQLNNDRSWFKRVFKRTAARLKIESAKEHNNFWTPQSMAAQLEAKGFRIESARCYRYLPSFDSAPVGKRLPYGLHLGLCHVADTLGRILMPRGGGNFTIVARSPEA